MLFAPLWLMACATEAPIVTEFETVEIKVPVRTPIDDELLTHPVACTYPPTPALYIFDLDVMIKCLETGWRFYAREIETIREVNTGPNETDIN